jgi:hypothetical protein
MTSPQYDPEEGRERFSAFIRHFIFYRNGAARRAKGILSSLFPDACFEFGGEDFDAVMSYEGETFPVFINIYPYLQPEQVVDDIAHQRKTMAKQRSLTLFITPPDEADSLADKVRDEYGTLNAGVYIWKLDLEETEHGWEWKRGEVVPVFSLL